ncbi:hypothetical protein BH23PAT1_BH23PAT1_5490 [soil metagenome]
MGIEEHGQQSPIERYEKVLRDKARRSVVACGVGAAASYELIQRGIENTTDVHTLAGVASVTLYFAGASLIEAMQQGDVHLDSLDNGTE